MFKINFGGNRFITKKNSTSTELNIRNTTKNILKPLCYIFLYIFILLYFILRVFHISKKFSKKSKPRKNFTDMSISISSKKPTLQTSHTSNFINHVSFFSLSFFFFLRIGLSTKFGTSWNSKMSPNPIACSHVLLHISPSLFHASTPILVAQSRNVSRDF